MIQTCYQTSFTPILSRRKAQFSFLGSLPNKADTTTNEYNWHSVRASALYTIIIWMFLRFLLLSNKIILSTMGCRFLTKFIKLACEPYTNGHCVRISVFFFFIFFVQCKKIRIKIRRRRKKTNKNETIYSKVWNSLNIK